MPFAIVNAQGIYAGAWSRYDNPPRTLLAGESVVDCEVDANGNPIGIPLPDPGPEQRLVTPSEFIALLTDAEIVAFQSSTNATVVRHWIGLTTNATDFNSLDTIEMFDFFVSLNLLTQPRASEILG